MATDGEFGSETISPSQEVMARPRWSVGSRVTAALAVVTVVLLLVHLWSPIPVWIVWCAGGLTLAAFVAAVAQRWRRSLELEQDLF